MSLEYRSHLRFGPIAVAAALLFGLTFGVAMPLSSVSAGVLATLRRPPSRFDERSRQDDVIIVVATRHDSKNWNNNKNWNNKNWNNKKSSWSGPTGMEQAALLWHRDRWRGARHHFGRRSLFGRSPGAKYLLVLGRSFDDARLLGLLLVKTRAQRL